MDLSTNVYFEGCVVVGAIATLVFVLLRCFKCAHGKPVAESIWTALIIFLCCGMGLFALSVLRLITADGWAWLSPGEFEFVFFDNIGKRLDILVLTFRLAMTLAVLSGLFLCIRGWRDSCTGE